MLNALRVGRLQVKLLWLVFIASLPAFVVLFWVGLIDHEQSTERATSELASIGHLVRSDQQKQLESVRHTLTLLSRVPVLRAGNAKACSSLLEDLQNRQSLFYNLGVFNVDGSPRCSAIPLSGVGSVADTPWFRRALETRQFTVSGYVFDRPPGLHTLQFAIPLYDLSDQVSGIVFASWELTSHEQSLAALKLDAGNHLVLADRTGVVLSSYPASPASIGHLLPDKPLLDAISVGTVDGSVIGNENSASDLSRIEVVRIGDAIAMYTIAITDRTVVVSPIRRRAYLYFAALLATLALVMAAAWRLGGQWVTQRAKTVSTVAQQIGTGQFRARTGFRTSGDEFDQIGFAIDRMADSLEHRDADLRITNRRVSEAQRIAKLGHWELDVPSNRGWWSLDSFEMFSIKAADDSFDAYLDWVHPDDRAQLVAANARMMATGARVDVEYRTIGTDGKLRWIHAVSEGSCDETGHVVKLSGVIQDVTERKDAAAALVASEERYRLLFNSNPLPIAMYDPVTLQYTAANEAFCNQYGYSETEFKDKRVTDLNVPENHEALQAQIRALPIGVSTRKGLRNIKRDGTVIDVDETRIKTEIGGKPVVISSPLDVTDRLRTEYALETSEERYRQIFEGNPLPLWVYDPETLKFLDVNGVACTRYGYTREEFLSMTIRDIKPPQDVAALEQRLPRNGETVVGSDPRRHLRKDGSVILVEINNHEVFLRGRRARLVCPIDVTDKMHAQEEVRRMNLLLERKVEIRTAELSRSLALQQSLFDNVPQIVWLAELDGSITFANRIWSETISAAPNDWMGEGWSNSLHPDDRDRVLHDWQRQAPLLDFFDIEYRLSHRDGGYHDYQVKARKVFGKTGDPICWVGICTDVTDSRRREEALRFANQELDAFSSSVSHDLRAPLRTISGFSERLQNESANRLDEQCRHYLDRIRAGAANMSELIDGLLSLSQVTLGDMAISNVDLSALAREVFEELRQLEPDHPAEIIIRDNLNARGDARLLRILLVNLLGNALKFSAKRDVSRIEFGETAVAGKSPTFFVRDNGAGFDPAYASKIFGVFQRLHSTAEFPGTGIGLATVQRIVHRHNGQISASGAVNQGATIYFTLHRD